MELITSKHPHFSPVKKKKKEEEEEEEEEEIRRHTFEC
jgi:hypothetical protein